MPSLSAGSLNFIKSFLPFSYPCLCVSVVNANYLHHGGTEVREEEGYNTLLTIPSLITATLKFNNRPTFLPLNRMYVSSCAS